eukprot:jgi/Ulvmu1/6580/UM003_0217.1
MASDLEGVLQCGAYFPGTVMDIFRAADVNGDGIVSGKEAVDFFMSTGLAQSNLSQVWEAATASQPGGLTPSQFSRAMRLVSLLQVGCVFSKEFVDKALHPTTGLQLPTPKVGEQFLALAPAEAGPDKPQGNGKADKAEVPKPQSAPKPQPAPKPQSAPKPSPVRSLPKPPKAPAPPAAAVKPTSNGNATPPKGRSLKLSPEPQIAAAPLPDGPNSQELSPTGPEDDEAALTANAWRRHAPANTLRLDVRLQPHNEAVAAPLQMLCAAQEMLLAAPTRAGGVLCFARSDYKPTEPQGYWPMVRNGEDPASVTGKECKPERVPAGPVTSMHVCPYTEMLLTGHKDGAAIAWHMDMSNPERLVEPPMQQRLLLRAHTRSAVSAMLTTPWGALWTAGSSGSLRWWPTAMVAAMAAPHSTALDWSALPQCELRRTTGERAHGMTASLQLTSGGQVVVAASRTRATLWDAFSGRFLGVLAIQGIPLDTPYLVDPGAGVRMSPGTGRAATSPEGPLPQLGTTGEEMLPGEEAAKLAQRLNSVAITTSTIAKKGFSGMKSIVSRQISKGREALMAQAAQQQPPKCSPAPDDEVGEEPEGEEQQQPEYSSRRVFITCTADNRIWSISEHGVVEVFTAGGKAEGKFEAAFASAVCCAAAFSGHVWLGLASGRAVAVDCRTRTRAAAQDLHDSAVVSLQQVGLTLYALARSGAVSGVNACVLPKTLPSGAANPGYAYWQSCWRRALEAWKARADVSVESVAVGVRVATWNVGEVRPGRDSIKKLLGVSADLDKELSADGIDILVVGLQEVEMGTASVAVGAVKEAMGKRVAEQVNHNARWWADEMHACLDQGCPLTGSGTHRQSWERAGLRQMSGLLLCVFVRRAMSANVANAATGVVACGVGGFGGNKGAVAVGFQLFRRRVLIMNSHFAAHQGAVKKRNADYSTILRRVAMPHQPALVATENPLSEPPPGHHTMQSMPPALRAAAGALSRSSLPSPAGRREESLPNPHDLPAMVNGDPPAQAAPARPDAAALGYRSAAMMIWCGDFNYRIDMDRAAVEAAVKAGSLDQLKAADQARRQMAAGAVFHGMREAALSFAPTYKFDKGVPGPHAYDSSEKQRVPAWTDRVFFKGSVPFPQLENPTAELDFNAHSPYPTAGVDRESADQLLVRCTHYDSLPALVDSDHKPVIARLRAEVPNVDHRRRRRHVGKALATFHDEVTASLAPHIRLPSTKLALQGDGTTVRLSNNGHADGCFLFRGWAQPSGADGDPDIQCVLPPWLSVFPNSGIVPAGGSMDVHVAVNRVQAGFSCDAVSGQKVVHVDLFMVVDGLRHGGISTTAANILKLQVTFKNDLQ